MVPGNDPNDTQTPTPVPAADAAAPAPEPVAEAAPPAPPDPLAAALARVETLEKEKAELKDRVLRGAADFDNYKKRSRKELGEAADRGREGLLREVLPVLDNLERAISHADAADGVSGLIDGVRLVHRQLLAALEKFDVKPFTAVGEAFDPQFHAAITQVETADQPAGMVVEEFQKGYRQGQRLLRPAMVAVSRPPQAAAPQPDAPGEGG
ncbi:MAG TPA: nucleotide exchange factor GrpE [Polyangia bacterium]|jgi:molecular chaperone GrpE